MWSLPLLALLSSEDAHARPLRTVVVRPLPAVVPVHADPAPQGAGEPTKAQLIAAAYVDYTVTHTALGRVGAKDGGLEPYPSVFTCVVTEHVLTVSYTREGIDPAVLPAFGTCGLGEDAVRFRIKVAPPTVGT
ncbi:MAG: hypothetical protein Q8P41_04775 [Pseudomonadota bacterium]|nr:hypothetical protein [Pseudomonadota bacterium]